jgi:drug/metabolite transporter (DMT)-like permease
VRSETLSGIVFMTLGIACFATMDAAGKWAVRDMSVFQLLAVRSSFVTCLLLLIAPALGGRRAFRSEQPGAHVLRALCGASAFLFFFAAVRFLPLADTVAIAFGGPFIVTALSVPLLGETVDGRRWLGVVIGFLGMLLIVQPTGAGFRPAALLAVASSVCEALLMVLTRWLVKRSRTPEKTLTFLVYTFAVQAAVGFAGGIPVWKPMSGTDLALAVAVGVLALGGHIGITLAFQRAPASVLAPFEYTALIWSTTLGYFVFKDFPAASVWLGVSVIIASGLYTVRRARAEA